jgi:hypothetical protein
MKIFSLSILFIMCFIVTAYGQIINRQQINKDSIYVYSDVKDGRNRFVIDTVVLSGNKVTKEKIIFRELTFLPGDTISAYELVGVLKQSRANLMNTSLFNFVTITDSIVAPGKISHIIIKIDFVERWYLWPFPIFEMAERNLNVWWEDKDFSKVNYGVFLTLENCRGRMETLKLLLRFGYDEKYELSYNIPYINKKQTFGLGFGAGWSQNHEIAYQTFDNGLLFVHDENDYMIKNYYSFLNLTHRPNFYQHHLFQISYNYYSIADTVLELNPDYSFNNQKTNEYFTLLYKFAVDRRDYKVYPLKGTYYDLIISKSGLGILKNGDISMLEIGGSLRKYFQMSKKFHASVDLAGKISTNPDQPYFYQRGLGFGRTFVRGYELFVVDGQSYALAKNTVKFTLIPTTEKNIPFIHSDKFGKIHYALYLNAFFDIGYVRNYVNYEYNNLSNRVLFGTGFGVDLVTYYDVVFRVEYTINRQGQSGIYVHFKDTL